MQIKRFFNNFQFNKIKNKYIFALQAITALIFLIILINILIFSYKAYLYPIRLSQYYDECSYLSMGNFFKLINPVEIFKNYIIPDKPLPNLYNEFQSRVVYWPVILSIPLNFTQDIINLHIFKALLLTIGTLIVFLIGYRLSGLTSAVVLSAFWIGTPILNYWGHFFMSDGPSLVFYALGILLLLYSDKNGFVSFFAGIFLGISAFMRFTTIVLVIPAFLLIIAVYFKPHKRKSFQVFGELCKCFTGLFLAMFPFLIFTNYLFKNPLVPFKIAKNTVENMGINDPGYYFRNLLVESGSLIKLGVILAVLAPVIYALTKYIIYKNSITGLKNKFLHNIKHIKLYSSYFLYHIIIILTFSLTVFLYLKGVGSITHKLPRYLMGSILPLSIIASIGLGQFEPFLRSIFKKNLLSYSFNQKKYLIITVIIGCIYFLSIFSVSFIIWNKTMNRTFYSNYKMPDKILEKYSASKYEKFIRRLQPEYNDWNCSLHERLKDRSKDIDGTDYFGKTNHALLKKITKLIKKDEVLYVDKLNYVPYICAYFKKPCILIKSTYNKNIKYLISNNELYYKGYIIVNSNPDNDIFEHNNKIYTRSLNKNSLLNNNKIKLLFDYNSYSVFYFKGKSFNF